MARIREIIERFRSYGVPGFAVNQAREVALEGGNGDGNGNGAAGH